MRKVVFLALCLAACPVLMPVLRAAIPIFGHISVYKGVVRSTTHVAGERDREFVRRAVVFDTSYARCTIIDYGRFNGKRGYIVQGERDTTALSIVPVSAQNSRISLQTEADTGLTDPRVVSEEYFSGRTALLRVQQGLSDRAVERFTGHGSTLVIGTPQESSTRQEKFRVSYWKRLSVAANNASDTFDAAVARVITELENDGFENLQP